MKFPFHSDTSHNINMVYKTYNYQKVCVSASEDRYVHGHPDRVGLIQPHSKVPLPTQEQQNENPNVHQTNSSCKESYENMWNVFEILTWEFYPIQQRKTNRQTDRSKTKWSLYVALLSTSDINIVINA